MPCLQIVHHCKQLLSIGLLLAFYFQRQLGVLTSGPRILQNHLHLCAPQKASQSLGNVTLVLTTSPLKGRTHFTICPSTQMNPLFFKRSMNGLASAKKSFMNFLLKLTNPRIDLTFLAETKLCHFLIDLIFLG